MVVLIIKTQMQPKERVRRILDVRIYKLITFIATALLEYVMELVQPMTLVAVFYIKVGSFEYNTLKNFQLRPE